MSTRKREISGRLTQIRQRWEKDDGVTMTIIAEFSTAEGCITIKGEIFEGEMLPGLSYRLYGMNVTHPKYGSQFAFDTVVEETPVGQIAVMTYLQQCDGIGPVSARKIWEKLGDKAIETIRETPIVIRAIVPRITDEQLFAAQQRLRQQQKTERAKMDLLAILHGKGLPKRIVDKCIAVWGSKAAELVRRNPYLLMQFRGVGFLKTDRLWTEFGLPPVRLKRQALCLWHAIAKDSSGDTWFPIGKAKAGLTKNISGSGVNFERALTLAVRAGLLAVREGRVGKWVAEKKKADAERELAELILEAEEDLQPTEWPEIDGLPIYDHQREELGKALNGFIGILAGSPGTGKTHTAASVIKKLIETHGLDHIAVCAPTGKAAVRVSEAMEENKVPLKACTIHSLLGISSGDDGDNWGFVHGRGKPLEFKFVIVDESSMIDTALMRSLLAARGLGTHVLFIGDPHQLAPVGHGAPLRDMIAAGVPSGQLTEIHRNAGRIVRACAEIRDTGRFTTSEKLNVEAGENLIVMKQETPEDQIETLTAFIEKIKRSENYDATWDVQVIVAVNKKSELGRKPLNAKLQELLNPDGETVKGCPFRVGDKIINTKNGKFPNAVSADVERDIYVANGEQAEVLEVSAARVVARLQSPDRMIVIPRKASEGDEEGGSSDDESTGTGCSWELGYAISCHKSQGSEWPVVIVMLDEHQGAQMVCSKQWLFTAISRAKSFCLLIGKYETALRMCRQDALFERKTFLVELLNAGREEVATYQEPTFDELLDAALCEVVA